jgi:hypothetical protein
LTSHLSIPIFFKEGRKKIYGEKNYCGTGLVGNTPHCRMSPTTASFFSTPTLSSLGWRGPCIVEVARVDDNDSDAGACAET